MRAGGVATAVALCLPLGLLLAGCSMPATMNPVDWWHGLEGGRIAQDRPPPPGVDAPYPNLGTIPAKPVPLDAATRGRIASALLADRANAQYAASLAPLPAAPAAAAAASNVPPPAPAAGETMSASLPAVSAPPSPPKPVAGARAASPPAPGAPAAAGAPMPAVPPAPPPPPALAGIPATTAPTPPPPTPPARPPAPVPAGAPVEVPFVKGSAELTTPARNALRQFALRRAAAAVAVTGYGDAAGSNPDAQTAALPLAWRRAQTISGFLQTAGVPATSLRVTAEAIGHGGVAAIAP
jgi:outer membrane protein OmpA-like peptidoglycan-associated protein